MPLPGFFPPPFCTETPAAEVVSRAAAALQRFPDGKMAEFYQNVAEAQNLIPCTSEALTPTQAAIWHQAMAIFLSVEKDDGGALASLRAAQAADSGRGLPDAVTAVKPALASLEVSARSGPPSAGVAVLAPEGRTILVDGKSALLLPTDRPYILQVLWTSDGKVHWSGMVPVGTRAPDLALIAPLPLVVPVCPVCPTIPDVVALHPPRPSLVVGALGSSALALGLYVSAVTTDHIFWDPATDEGRLEGLQTRANALQWSAVGVGVVALSLDGLLGIKTVRAFRTAR